MSNLPPHPFIVHIPVSLALLVPLLFAGIWIGIRKGLWPNRTWAIVVAFQAIFFFSTIVALKTGHNEEEKVESVAGESAVHDHEEWGDKMPWASGATLVLLAGSLFLRKGKSVGLTLALISSGVGLALGLQTGKTGGVLVYQYDAPKAYAPQVANTPEGHEPEAHEHHDH